MWRIGEVGEVRCLRYRVAGSERSSGALHS
jgi:hypothetical protein